jgi:hypothetical protein
VETGTTPTQLEELITKLRGSIEGLCNIWGGAWPSWKESNLGQAFLDGLTALEETAGEIQETAEKLRKQ